METFVFAILASYLFFRLWSVLGTRTGYEKRKINISFLNENTVKNEDESLLLEKKTVNANDLQELDRKVERLKSVDSSFNSENFLRSAKNVFKRIIIGFSKGDLDTLKKLLSMDAFKTFEVAIEDRNNKKMKREAEVFDVEAEIIDVEIDHEQNAFVKLIFRSEQMIANVDENGKSYDNPSRLSVSMVDEWTFTKKLEEGVSKPIWYLHTTYSCEA